MNVGEFAGIFALMFLLELPDKTMVATIVMSTRARPSSIVLGASAGFIVQMGIAVSAGGLISLLPVHAKDAVVAALFLGGAGYLLFVSGRKAEEQGEHEATPEHAATRLREILTAFGVIFVGEFGDLTQILTANLAAKYHSPAEVFIGAFAGLATVAALGAFGGRALLRVLPLAVIRKAGGVLLAGFAIYTLVNLVRG